MRRVPGIVPRIALYALPIALYLALSLPRLELPGLMFEQATGFAKAMALLRGLRVNVDDGWAVEGWGRQWPLMRYAYIGTEEVFVDLPFVWFGGGDPAVARLSFVFITMFSLIAFLWLLRRGFGDETALAAGLVGAAHPRFVLANRSGDCYDEFYLILFILLGLCALTRWYDERRRSWLSVFGLCWGMAWWARPAALWYYAPAAVFGYWLVRTRRAGGIRWSWIVAGWLVGAVIPLAHNLTHGSILPRLMWARLTHVSPFGTNNLEVASNLATRCKQFRLNLDASPMTGEVGVVLSARLVPWWFAIGYVCLLNACRKAKQTSGPRGLLYFLCAAPVILLAESCFTLSLLFFDHLTSLLPFAIAAATVGFSTLRESVRPRVIGRALFWIATVAVLAGELRFDYLYARELSRTGGSLINSTAVYRLSEYVLTERRRSFVSLSQESYFPILFLTEFLVQPQALFWSNVDETEKKRAHAAIQRGFRFIYFAPHYARHRLRSAALEALDRWAREQGRPLAVEKEFRDAAGEPVFVVYSAQACGLTATNSDNVRAP